MSIYEQALTANRKTRIKEKFWIAGGLLLGAVLLGLILLHAYYLAGQQKPCSPRDDSCAEGCP